jgi:hypothetical protein
VGQVGRLLLGKSAEGCGSRTQNLFSDLEQGEGAPRLWIAVLAQALRDYYGDIPSEGPGHYREVQLHYCRRTAKAWFMSDATEMGTFRWIADLFEFDARAVRKRLLVGPRIDLEAGDKLPAQRDSEAAQRAVFDDATAMQAAVTAAARTGAALSEIAMTSETAPAAYAPAVSVASIRAEVRAAA